MPSSIIPNLPWECIKMVIDQVDNSRDLFNLLTVSSDIFLIAARRLYHDPVKYCPFPPDRYHHGDYLYKLVRFLLSLSPVRSESIDKLRESFGLCSPGKPRQQYPMLNYLSLIKVVHWRRAYSLPKMLGVRGYSDREIYMHFTWAIVGHRLGEIEELTIDVEDQERYLNNAAQMTCLRRIWVHLDKNSSHRDMYDFAEAMIKAIQLHHGPSQLRECNMIPVPCFYDPIYTFSSEYEITYQPHDIDLSRARRVLSLLPSRKHYATLPKPDGSTVLLDHPFDPFVATIKDMWEISLDRCNFLLEILWKAYPGHSSSQLLQRFRGLTSMTVPYGWANGNDQNLFAWAACEAEHYYDHHQPDGRRQLAPLVPLEKLTVSFDVEAGSTRVRGSIPKWKILQDALHGFSGTLKCLNVSYPQHVEGIVGRMFTIPRPFHKLKLLNLQGLAVDRSVWEQAPNIEELKIIFEFQSLRERAITPKRSQNGQPAHTTTTTTTAVAAEHRPQQQFAELWINCPKLTKLTLEHQAINYLDPNCFHLLPSLQCLRMFNWSVIARQHISKDEVEACEEREALKVLYPSHWTWDWPFPALSYLNLTGDLHEIRFSFSILRSCPALKTMVLSHQDTSRRFPLRVKGILDASLDMSSNQTLSFTQTSLRTIEIKNNWEVEVDELACLLQVLPRLLVIELGSVHYGEGFRDRDLIEITKAHPALTTVYAGMKHSFKSLSALGLWNIIDRPGYASGSFTRVKDARNDNKVPMTPGTITYIFCIRDRGVTTKKVKGINENVYYRPC